jgi:hypothetical protein
MLRNAVAIALQQTLCRFSLWIACHGVILPWYSWAEGKVSAQTLQRYRRRAMVARLRASRFKISRGPFVLRGALESLFTFLRFMQFPATLSLKFSAAILLCLFPFIVFFVVRIYLPVPQRLARVNLNLNMKTVGESEVIQPTILRRIRSSAFGDKSSGESAENGFYDFKELDDRTGEGYFIQGKGSAHEESWRGWKLSSGEELTAKFKGDFSGRTIRVKYKVVPSEKVDGECRIDVTNSAGEFLFASGFDAKRGVGFNFQRSPLTRRLQEKLMPDLAGMKAGLTGNSVTLNLAGNNPALNFRVSRLDSGDSQVCSILIYGFEQVRRINAQAEQSKRNLLMFLFKSMNVEVASDSRVMPWMSSILRSPVGYIFNQHHALDLREDNSFRQIMGVSAEKTKAPVNPEVHLVERLRRTGYKIVLIGDFDSNDVRAQLRPDIAVRINNETYQAQLSLKQLFRSLEEESTTPVFVLLRLKGMQSRWWPVASNLEFQKMFMGGHQRGVTDTLLYAHAKSLDAELSLHFDQLKTSGAFSKFDFLLTAERGLDLGLNISADDRQKGTFLSDLLLNQESLKVPLLYIPASGYRANLGEVYKFVQNVTTHSDLSRSLWETLGVTDSMFPVEARRLWQNSGPFPSRGRGAFASLRDSSSQIKAYPLHSRIQQGVLFADPDSAGGFLKYVTQPVPFKVKVPATYGWPTADSIHFPSGEQFRQISRRGTREEILGRVNSNFVREARRVIRIGRSLPLRFRFEFHESMPVDMLFTEQGRSSSLLKTELPEGLRLSTTAAPGDVFVHRIAGFVKEADRMDLLGGLTQLQFSGNRESSVFVACPEAFVFSPEALNAAVAQKSLCLLETPSTRRVNYLKLTGKKIITVWLVEDEKRRCIGQKEIEETETEYSDCAVSETAE